MSYPWIITLTVLVCTFGGIIIGYYISKWVFKNQLKKHPPISEKAIRAMYKQMGRTASEAQIKAVMRAMNDANK